MRNKKKKLNSYTKSIVKKGLLGLIAVLALFLGERVLAQDFSSGSFTVTNPVLSAGSNSSTSTSFGLGQSIFQNATGISTSTSFQVWSGFQYYYQVSANTLTATAGNASASLSWSVPQTFLGVSVGAYEVGVGTVSGTYSYTSAGNVTSYTATGLTNGTPYYFKIKAKTAWGSFLVFSNEATATPSGSATPTPPEGGGGGGGGRVVSQITFSGQAYPKSTIYVLLNAQTVGSASSDDSGYFSLTLPSLSPGSYQFLLYAKDANGNRSALISLVGTVKPNSGEVINNIFLPPTVVLDKTEVKQGDDLTVSGFAQPGATVNFLLDPAPGSGLNFQSNAESNGEYNFTLNTGVLTKGDYFFQARSRLKSLISMWSDKTKFIVGEKNVLKPHDLCPKTADLNGDCRVDLVDFSILAYWYLRPNPLEKVDLNRDGVVDLVDFSILAYYWEG